VQFHRRRCERFARLESASRTQFERQTEHRLSFLLSCHSTPSNYAQERRHDHQDHRKYFCTQKGRCRCPQCRLMMNVFLKYQETKVYGKPYGHNLSPRQNNNLCVCTALHSVFCISISADIVFICSTPYQQANATASRELSFCVRHPSQKQPSQHYTIIQRISKYLSALRSMRNMIQCRKCDAVAKGCQNPKSHTQASPPQMRILYHDTLPVPH
jgi:hypothetical protein